MANEYLQRTPTSTGNRKVWTFSAWIKKNDTTSNIGGIFIADANWNTGNFQNYTSTWFAANNAINSTDRLAGVTTSQRTTPFNLRDFSSWFHLLISFNATLNSPNERHIIYINGIKSGDSVSFATSSPINKDTQVNLSGIVHAIGNWVAGANYPANAEFADIFLVDGQALTPDVFGFYKEGKGYISAGSTQATDFRPGQWVPKTPRVIKTEINRRGGFGVNGFYLPMNDSNNFGADFHCDPNSIIKLNEELPQPRVGVATTASVGLGYTNALREDPFAANLVLALPFVSGGLNSGFGDYAPSIKGSGTQKTITTSNVSIASTASYYGSANFFNGTNGNIEFSGSDFNFGTNDFTVEMWVNSTTGNGTRRNLYWGGDAGGSDVTSSLFLEINASNQLRFSVATNGSYSGLSGGSISLNQWNHIALVKRRTTVTGYLNGVAVGIDTNCTGTVNTNANPVQIGGVRLGNLFGGYIQDLRIYNGVAKYTGGFDVPKPYTPVGIATWRAVPDCTANNFATFNPLFNSVSGDVVLADGNLTYTGSQGSSYGMTQGTVGVSTNKWYWEVRVGAFTPSLVVGVVRSGVSTSSYTVNPENSFVSGVDGGIAFAHGVANTVYYWSGAISSLSYTIPSCTTGDVISVALDLTGGTNSKIYFAKNGTWGASGDPATGTNPVGLALSGTYLPAISIGAAGASTAYFNFGQNPTFSGNTTAGTFTDSNGKGLFKYQPPSGFLALCEDNLPTPEISDPGEHFKTVLYAGTGSARSITGIGFTPDLVWIKERTSTSGHVWFDSVRGAGRYLFSVNTSAEDVVTDALSSFDSDGFSIAGNNGAVNESSSQNYVAWCWRAGAGTTSTNTSGSIQSVVSVNQTAGFSIVSYTGNNTAGATVGHGLGKTPSMIILKSRSLGTDWIVQHKSAGTAPSKLILNATNAVTNSAPEWNNTLPNSSTFTIGPTGYSVNNPGATYIAYCWAEIEGFSKAFSFVGNGSDDGPFVYCNFKPAFILIKRSDAVGSWAILDSARNSTNVVDRFLWSNLTDIEGTYTLCDFLSNGFKIRNVSNGYNASGGTYIGMAFAESPFTTANAK